MKTNPEYNMTGIDYANRNHFVSLDFPVIDIHSHVTMTSPSDSAQGPAGGSGLKGSTEHAEKMLRIAEEFGITKTISMCPIDDVEPLKATLGRKIGFNAMINKKPEESEIDVLKNLDRFLESGIVMVKLWSAPRGRERGFFVNAPWRKTALKHAFANGIRSVMVHVGDPDCWWESTYKDTVKFGTKAEQYPPFEEMLTEFPEFNWIGAHMGGDPEHPDHLQNLLEKYPHLYFDTSATKWQIREVSLRRDQIRFLIEKFPDRFLFGSDLVTRHGLDDEHYVSRYWCQRTLWESSWEGRSPIQDPEFKNVPPEAHQTPELKGVALSLPTLKKVYYENAHLILTKK